MSAPGPSTPFVRTASIMRAMPEALDRKDIAPIAIAAVIGMALWIATSLLTDRREPWDSDAFWGVAYPVAILACAVLAYAYPDRPWRWALALFLGQFLGMCVRNGEIGSLWPLGMALFLVISLPGVAAAKFVARFRTRSDSEPD
jgi:hypothetical protein